MKSERSIAVERVLTGVFARLFFIGEVWIWAWMFNPPITSNVVWFIALILSSVAADVGINGYRLIELKERLVIKR